MFKHRISFTRNEHGILIRDCYSTIALGIRRTGSWYIMAITQFANVVENYLVRELSVPFHIQCSFLAQ